MDKKIIKAMFDNICAKDVLRPIMNGVHFEEERCYASDGRVLVIYNEGSEHLNGKTMLVDGEEVEGIYPKVDSVFPKKDSEHTESLIDVEQLKNACLWHQKQLNSSDSDRVLLEGVGFCVNTLARFLKTITLFGSEQKFYFYGKRRAAVVIGDNFKGIIMPMEYDESEVDMKTEFSDECMVYSYENFINDYVFNSWKEAGKPKSLSWLD